MLRKFSLVAIAAASLAAAALLAPTSASAWGWHGGWHGGGWHHGWGGPRFFVGGPAYYGYGYGYGGNGYQGGYWNHGPAPCRRGSSLWARRSRQRRSCNFYLKAMQTNSKLKQLSLSRLGPASLRRDGNRRNRHERPQHRQRNDRSQDHPVDH